SGQGTRHLLHRTRSRQTGDKQLRLVRTQMLSADFSMASAKYFAAECATDAAERRWWRRVGSSRCERIAVVLCAVLQPGESVLSGHVALLELKLFDSVPYLIAIEAEERCRLCLVPASALESLDH